MSRYRNNLNPIVIAVLIFCIIGGLLIWHLVSSENEVDRKIQECLSQGGTPIVVGHQYTSEFKGCNFN